MTDLWQSAHGRGQVLGIDPGSHQTGWSIVQNGSLVKYDVIKLRKGDELHDRLLALGKAIDKILVENPLIDLVVIESPFVGRFPGAITALAAARAVAIYVSKSRGRPTQDINPKEVKSASGMGGGASKEQIQMIATRLFRLRVTPPEDAADAIIIGYAGDARRHTRFLGMQRRV